MGSAMATPGRTNPDASRSAISPGELAAVCARYDLGVVDRVYAFNRGSRLSPKAVVETERGRFLVKRRAAGRDDPERVAFSHDLQLYLQRAGFPTAPLIGTRLDNNSMVQVEGRVFEVFGFVEGERFDRTPAACEDAGRLLARLHEVVRGYTPRWPAPAWGVAQFGVIAQRLASIRERGIAAGPAAALERALADARAALPAAGEGPSQLLHADWHPGNMIFRAGRVAAVLDFDAARVGPVLLDVAGGVLQFSMARVGVRARDWPEAVDAHRFEAFLRGYARAGGQRVETEALAPMMACVLIGEVVTPVAASGRFGGAEPGEFLEMAARKAGWLLGSAPKLAALARRATA